MPFFLYLKKIQVGAGEMARWLEYTEADVVYIILKKIQVSNVG